MNSDLDEELLGMAESRSDDGEDRKKSKKRRKAGGEPSAKRRKAEMSADPDSTDEDAPASGKADPDATESEPGESGDEKEEGEASENDDDDDEEEDDDDEDDDDDDDDDEDDDIESEDGDIKIAKPALKRSSSSKDKASSGAAADEKALADREKEKEREKAKAAEAARAKKEKAAASRAAARAKKEKAEREKERKAREKEKEKARKAKEKEKEKASKGKKGGSSKYPLEGKYIDEADRARLDQLPEMEREFIISSRLEEMKDEEDAKRLELMYKQTVAQEKGSDEDSGSGEDMDMDIDDEDMGTGVIIEKTAVVETRPAVLAKTAKLDKYHAARESRAKRLANKTDRPSNANRRLSESDYSDGPSSEEGSITNERPHHSRRRSDEDEFGGRALDKKAGKDKEDKVKMELPLNPGDMNAVRLSRYDLADYRYRAFFAEMAAGAYVKCAAGMDDQKRTKYRIFEVISVEPPASTYNMEYKGQQVPDNRRLMLKYGSLKKPFKMSDVSNQDFTADEFMRWQATMKADEQRLPVKSTITKKHAQLKEFRDKPMTDADIQAKLKALKNLGQTTGVDVSATRLRLRQDRGLAIRRGDDARVRALDAELAQLDYDISLSSGSRPDIDVQADLLARVNEKNKRDGAQASRRAHKADIERRKVAEKVGMMDPSARVKSRLQQHTSDLPAALAEALLQDSVVVDGNSSGEVVMVAGEHAPITDSRKLEQAVAMSVDLDLGDF